MLFSRLASVGRRAVAARLGGNKKKDARSLAPRCVSAQKAAPCDPATGSLFFLAHLRASAFINLAVATRPGALVLGRKTPLFAGGSEKNRLGKSRPIESGRGVCVKSTHTQELIQLSRGGFLCGQN